MSEGQTARSSLLSRRVRLALGATAAAAALALGGTFTAHADNSGPAPEKSDKIRIIDVCAEPDPVEDPVDAEPGGKAAPSGNAKDAKVYEFTDEDPVDAEPVDDCVEDPEPGGDPVEAVPGGDDDLGKPDSYVDVELGTVKH